MNKGYCSCSIVHVATYSAIYKSYTQRMGYICNTCDQLIKWEDQ